MIREGSHGGFSCKYHQLFPICGGAVVTNDWSITVYVLCI